ncbi:hypothetical protein BD289DRAFT_212197 [Coniella lustricola]|uniref:Uncharacterized protein n=1 Tax=Coniella lustricola TaxID=2025994 RepID=A0A2T3ABG8_9PEZI|nr:hypothetical protein BD289DRAFT_212197 [Coniella lustricola]
MGCTSILLTFFLLVRPSKSLKAVSVQSYTSHQPTSWRARAGADHSDESKQARRAVDEKEHPREVWVQRGYCCKRATCTVYNHGPFNKTVLRVDITLVGFSLGSSPASMMRLNRGQIAHGTLIVQPFNKHFIHLSPGKIHTWVDARRSKRRSLRKYPASSHMLLLSSPLFLYPLSSPRGMDFFDKSVSAAARKNASDQALQWSPPWCVFFPLLLSVVVSSVYLSSLFRFRQEHMSLTALYRTGYR